MRIKKIIIYFLIYWLCAFSSPSFANNLISLDFKHIVVKDLLKILGDFSQKNIIVSDKVVGRITIKLNDVTWSDALDVILNMQNLSKREENNLIIILPNSNSTSSAKASINSKVIKIHYTKAEDIANLLAKQRSLLASDGAIAADARTNSILVSNSSDKSQIINNFIKDIDIPVKQILIEGQIVTVDSEFTKDLGLQFGTIKDIDNGDSDGISMDFPTVSSNPGHFNFTVAKLNGDMALDMELSALESEGHAKIVSKPKLLTANNQMASIESGEEIPYQEETSSGATNIAFKKAVLSLKVTPEMLSDDKIILHIQLNQDKV